MDEEIKVFKEGKDLISWLEENDILMRLDIVDAEILIGYMEGHGYLLASKDKEMLRLDLCDGMKAENYSIDEAIDIVCEWNYELILDAAHEKISYDSEGKYLEAKERYEAYKEDEKRLDKMYEQTYYGKAISKIGASIAEATIERAESNNYIYDDVGKVR